MDDDLTYPKPVRFMRHVPWPDWTERERDTYAPPGVYWSVDNQDWVPVIERGNR